MGPGEFDKKNLWLLFGAIDVGAAAITAPKKKKHFFEIIHLLSGET